MTYKPMPQSGIGFFISTFTNHYMRWFLFIFFLTISNNSFAKKGHFKASNDCINAYEELISFRITNGRKYLSQAIKEDPYNRIIILLQNYDEFIRLTFDDDPAVYKKNWGNKEKRLRYINNSIKNSPYYLLCKGIIHLQWSIIHIKYQENWRAANDFRKAHNYFKENKKLYPNFKENDIFYGAQKTIIGTLPSNYQWISNLIGMRGNVKMGMQLLRNSTKIKNPLFKHDAIFYYIFLNEIVLNDSKKAQRLLTSYKADVRNNYLYTFMKSNLMLNNFKASEAITVINNRNQSKGYLQPIIFNYSLGAAYLHQLNYSKSILYLKKYLATKSHFYKKDAALKIAYAYYLQEREKSSTLYKNKIPTVGSSIADMDKQAMKEFKRKSFGNKSLLKARLLFDGGNFAKCIQILENKSKKTKLNEREELEWNYRLARVYDESRKTNSAIIFYKRTLNTDNPTKEYYPARAALQLGFIFEKQNNRRLALSYFEKVLAMQGHQYKSSLDQKAKSGILRIKGK